MSLKFLCREEVAIWLWGPEIYVNGSTEACDVKTKRPSIWVWYAWVSAFLCVCLYARGQSLIFQKLVPLLVWEPVSDIKSTGCMTIIE